MLALVTGGGRRLGAAISARLATAGFDLALHAHAASDPDPALAATMAQAGIRSAGFVADLRDPAAVDALIPAIAAAFGRRPDCIVNSASLFEADDWSDVDIASLTDHFAVNAAAPARLTQQLFAAISAGQHGVVVNILDQRIAAPPIDQAGYTASKLALAAMTETMARAYAPRLRINAVAPGLTLETPDYAAGQMDRLAALMPLGRLPRPEDVADAVLFLIRAQATTGQTIFVDGGARLRCFERDFVFMARDAQD